MTLRALGIVALVVAAGCRVEGGAPTAGVSPTADVPATANHEIGELAARPDPSASTEAPTGRQRVDAGIDGSLILVPASYRPGKPMPFALTLHGCCGSAGGGLSLWRDHAEREGIILYAPDGGSDWGFGDPVARIDDGLRWMFERYAVDPERVAVVGFSAGATFALALGLANGELFTHVVAHSPGALYPLKTDTRPRIYVIHGTEDETIPIGASKEKILPELRRRGFDVTFVEYKGGHKRQHHLLGDSVDWFLRDQVS